MTNILYNTVHSQSSIITIYYHKWYMSIVGSNKRELGIWILLCSVITCYYELSSKDPLSSNRMTKNIIELWSDFGLKIPFVHTWFACKVHVRRHQDSIWVCSCLGGFFGGQALGCRSQKVTLGTRTCLHPPANLLISCWAVLRSVLQTIQLQRIVFHKGLLVSVLLDEPELQEQDVSCSSYQG